MRLPETRGKLKSATLNGTVFAFQELAFSNQVTFHFESVLPGNLGSVKQSNALLANAPSNLAQTRETPIYLTLKEVADLLKVKPRTVYSWVSDNRIPFERKGSLLRFRLDAVLAWNEPAG